MVPVEIAFARDVLREHVVRECGAHHGSDGMALTPEGGHRTRENVHRGKHTAGVHS